MRSTIAFAALLLTMLSASAQEGAEAPKHLAWSIFVSVLSPGMRPEHWAFRSSTQARCEALRRTVRARFAMDSEPHCRPEIITAEAFNKLKEHEEQAEKPPEKET